MVHWWICQIRKNNTVTIPFIEGDVLFAKNSAERVILFDGKREALIPKLAMGNIKLIVRLGKDDSDFIDGNYQKKKATAVTWASEFIRSRK